jgi:hypothetical protein
MFTDMNGQAAMPPKSITHDRPSTLQKQMLPMQS